METDEQFRAPSERRVVGSTENVIHGVSVPFHEFPIRLGDPHSRIAGEHSPYLLNRDGHPFHDGRGSHGLCLQVAPETSFPGTRKRTLEIETLTPSVELLAKGLNGRGN